MTTWLRTQLTKPVWTRIPRSFEPLRVLVPSDVTASPGKQVTFVLWYREAAIFLICVLSPHGYLDRLSAPLAFKHQTFQIYRTLLRVNSSSFCQKSPAVLLRTITSLPLISHSLKLVEDFVPTTLLFSHLFFFLIYSLSHQRVTNRLLYLYSSLLFIPTYLAYSSFILPALLLGMLHAS